MTYFSEISCPFRLLLKTENGNGIMYKWETKNGTVNDIDANVPLITNETTFFDNVFRLQTTQVLKNQNKI